MLSAQQPHNWTAHLIIEAAPHEGGPWERRARVLHGRQKVPHGALQRHDLHQPHELMRLMVHQRRAHQRILVALMHTAVPHVASGVASRMPPGPALQIIHVGNKQNSYAVFHDASNCKFLRHQTSNVYGDCMHMQLT